LSNGTCRHKERVREKTKKYGNWKKANQQRPWEEYKKIKQNAKRVFSSAKGKKQKECASNLNNPNHQTRTSNLLTWWPGFH